MTEYNLILGEDSDYEDTVFAKSRMKAAKKFQARINYFGTDIGLETILENMEKI